MLTAVAHLFKLFEKWKNNISIDISIFQIRKLKTTKIGGMATNIILQIPIAAGSQPLVTARTQFDLLAALDYA